MRKLLLAGAAFLALGAGAAQAQSITRVEGTVSQSHTGVALACFVVAGQWYAIPTMNGTGYDAQATAELLAAEDGRSISFEADTSQMFQCGGSQPATWAHDIDEVYGGQ